MKGDAAGRASRNGYLRISLEQLIEAKSADPVTPTNLLARLDESDFSSPPD
jgi:hypothetical protein